jgi:hypothetical protein
MQLEFHCPRRNRIAPKIEAQRFTLKAQREEKMFELTADGRVFKRAYAER